jgi:hypothetical protein
MLDGSLDLASLGAIPVKGRSQAVDAFSIRP